MLAKHLLFLATRRPHNGLLAIPGESITGQTILQPPPPYIGPPHPQERQKVQNYEECTCDQREQHRILAKNQIPVNYKTHDNRMNYCHQQQRQAYDKNAQYYDRDRIKNYEENQRMYNRQTAKVEQQQFFDRTPEPSQQFYTLPSRKLHKESEPPRSVTPDITRGLSRAPLSAMHMFARHGQKTLSETIGHHGYVTADSHLDGNAKKMQNLPQQRQPPLDVRNRFATPLGLSALGYRFFASSPVYDSDKKSSSIENLQQAPFSPINPENNNGFKTSTPAGRSAPTVAERLALSATKCVSPTASGRSTPTNIILSPTKSTMSNEELFAAIHKSKKKLNIKDDAENLSPSGSLNSLLKCNAGTRHSWSPESHKTPEIPRIIQSPSPTSRMDFKRLLLQQSVKSGPTRLSAAEQLKMSRQQCQLQQYSQLSTQQNSLIKVLSPRSAWRFQTPRTDVLSSTIIEDTAAEEKAMKPSPENPSPISRLNPCRQLDLNEQSKDRLSIENAKNADSQKNGGITTSKSLNLLSGTRVPVSHVQNNVAEGVQTSLKSTLNACENRRMSNQLARAQFLASTPVSQNHSSIFNKRFRARSESPQHVITQKVSRSPSAPTLETAL